MHFLTADYIVPVSSALLKNGVIAVADDGTIDAVLSREDFLLLTTYNLQLTTYSGIITPGFINAHCHLELSHMKGKLAQGTGLPAFIGSIIDSREAEEEVIAQAIALAEEEMLAAGIVGVGDICNTTDTISQKKKNRLRYHNFIELFDLHPSRADEEFEKGKNLLSEFSALPHSASLTPHAPYSVSGKLFEKITGAERLISIHNQETASEGEMFVRGSGALLEKLSSFGHLYDDWKSTGKNSLQSCLPFLSKAKKILLVHNTYTAKEDFDFLQSSIYFCLCPNANLYIENRLPDMSLFSEHAFLKDKTVVGTDSYASNHQLSVLGELKTIARHAPFIATETLLRWATLNGAEFFGWQKQLGSIEKGKKPGLNLISGNFDYGGGLPALDDSAAVSPILL